MLLFMLSLGGIPPTAGFMGKFWLFGAAIESGYVWLAVIGVLNSAISLYYYIRIVVFMYLKSETIGSEPTVSASLALVLGVAVVATIVLGVYPRLLFEVAEAFGAHARRRRRPGRRDPIVSRLIHEATRPRRRFATEAESHKGNRPPGFSGTRTGVVRIRQIGMRLQSCDAVSPYLCGRIPGPRW